MMLRKYILGIILIGLLVWILAFKQPEDINFPGDPHVRISHCKSGIVVVVDGKQGSVSKRMDYVDCSDIVRVDLKAGVILATPQNHLTFAPSHAGLEDWLQVILLDSAKITYNKGQFVEFKKNARDIASSINLKDRQYLMCQVSVIEIFGETKNSEIEAIGEFPKLSKVIVKQLITPDKLIALSKLTNISVLDLSNSEFSLVDNTSIDILYGIKELVLPDQVRSFNLHLPSNVYIKKDEYHQYRAGAKNSADVTGPED